MIMLDLSASMNLEIGGVKTINIAKEALIVMLNEYQGNGIVKVQLGTFDAVGTPFTTGWVDIASALGLLNGLTPTGGTNYDAALAEMVNAFEDNAGKLDNANNVSYFLSDGKPLLSSDFPNPGNNPGENDINITDIDKGDGILGTEVTDWQNFVTANNIKSYAVHVGDSPDAKYLEPIAYDGSSSSENSETRVITTSLDALLGVLVDSVVATGQTFTGTINNDLMLGGLGEDIMAGKAGADSFIFDVLTMNADARDNNESSVGFDTDTITDFNATEGNKLDLSKLLTEENAGNLENYLPFLLDNGDTLINVKSDGAGNVDHLIKFGGVDLTSIGDYSQIIAQLLENNLIVD